MTPIALPKQNRDRQGAGAVMSDPYRDRHGVGVAPPLVGGAVRVGCVPDAPMSAVSVGCVPDAPISTATVRKRVDCQLPISDCRLQKDATSVCSTGRSRARYPSLSFSNRQLAFGNWQSIGAVCFALAFAVAGFAQTPVPNNDLVMRSLVAELDRSMANLSLGDLPKPYFLQYIAQDRNTYTMRAAYGALTRCDQDHSRFAASRVRVGSYVLDNTNVGAGLGGQTRLPLDDDEIAVRFALWSMTDTDYKQVVEILTRKIAYLRQKQIEDRPDDFSRAEPVQAVEPPAQVAFDRAAWQGNLKRLSARFKDYPEIQNADVTFYAGGVDRWIVNSEGTRLRTADTGAYLEIDAETQADDGMRLSDSTLYLGLQVGELPPIDRMLTDIDEMCQRLIALSKAPVLEQYTGPVLFEPIAAAKAFEALLGDRLCARPTPLGENPAADKSLEKKIGLRILPRSFQVHDDPTRMRFNDVVLAGAYTYDDEGVKPARVTLVENGILKTLLSARAPTKKIKQSNGHGRSGGFTDAKAHLGCLYISSSEGLSADELKKELIQAAKDEGLEFALRIAGIESVQDDGDLPNPVYIYKVFVEDGREELVRGMEFHPVEVKSLKRILAAGKEPKVYNSTSGLTSTIISPALLFEELELSKIEQEFDKPPILPSPLKRERTAVGR